MSGLCGMIGTDGAPVRAHALDRCLHALRHFGPEAGTWEGSAGGLTVALGARTSPNGSQAQPRLAADGGLALVGDVVLDCRSDLIAALGAGSSALPDEGLILAAYERWGEACIERLSGGFAFALVDRRRGGVLLARDQLGTRPLVLHERPGMVCFATTALALTDLPGIGHDLDKERVAEWLAFVMNSDATFVSGASPLPQGHAMWVDGHGARRRRYWALDPDRIADLGSPEAHALALREAFDDAVSRRLPKDGDVGVLLSGGLDSTAVAATAALLRAPTPVRTYTSIPPTGWSGPTAHNFDADEQALVLDLARWHPTLRPSFVDRHEGSLFGRHDDAFEAGSPPLRNPCNALWQSSVIPQAATDGVGTLLTGARGNLFFSADDPRWLVDLLRRGRLAAVRREVAATAAAIGRAPTLVARSMLLRELVPATVLRWRRARRGGLDPYADLALRSAGNDAEAVVRKHWTALDLEQRALTRHHAVQGVMAQGGGVAESLAVMEALTGVRLTDPTGDVRLMELCATQPSWVRRRDGRRRAVCRDAMADRLPPSIVERTRRGAQLPDWLDRMAAGRDELVDELAAARDSETCRELLDLDRIDAALRDWPDREHHLRYQFDTTRTYRYAVFRGLLMARYIRFFEDHARDQRMVAAKTAA